MKPRIPTWKKSNIQWDMGERCQRWLLQFEAYTTGIKELPFPELGKTVGESGWREQALTRDVLNVLNFGCIKFEVHSKHSSENM